MSQDKATYTVPELLKDNQYGLGSRGISLVELLVVMVILGILAGLAVPSYSHFKDVARNVRAMEEIRGLEKVINAYTLESGGTLPLDQSVLATLVDPKDLIDPWGHQYTYTRGGGRIGHAEVLNTDFDLYSSGSDGITIADHDIDDQKHDDDIVRADNGGYVGLGKDF